MCVSTFLVRRHWSKDVVEAAEAKKAKHAEETWRELYRKVGENGSTSRAHHYEFQGRSPVVD